MAYALGLGAGRPTPAGIVAMSGFIPTVEGWSADLDRPGLPVWITHGRRDPVISVEFAQAARDALTAAGADVTYREHDGATTSIHARSPSCRRVERAVEAAAPPRPEPSVLRTARSSARTRSVAMESISTIFPLTTVKPMTENGSPPGATTTPAAPSTSAGRTKGESRAKVSACAATSRAPRTTPSSRTQRPAVGARHDVRIEDRDSASKSPSREAAKKASTTRR